MDVADERNQIDFESICGRFGWEIIDGVYIPYIFRSTDKYCAIRIVETKLLNNYLHKMHFNVFNNARIPAYQLTSSEIKLLNEINSNHCNQVFGINFTNEDYIIRLEDMKIFYEYLRVCHYKLMTKSTNLRDRCGFIRINQKLIVSFVNKEELYIPVFYFEKNVFRTGVFLNGWDLKFLKFCFILQGIERSDVTIEVISLDAVKSIYPSGSFEPFWPDINCQSFLINNTETKLLHKLWTIQINNIDTTLVEYGKPLQQIQFNSSKYDGDGDGDNDNAPYHIRMLRVAHVFIPCINMKPHDSSDYLITLPDLVHHFFSGESMMKCKEVLDYLNIQLYRGDLLQMQQLWTAKKCQSPVDYLPLINLRDVRDYLPQISVILLSCND